jgi:hypothetical protein
MDVVRRQRLALDRDALACLARDPGPDGYQARYPSVPATTPTG